MTGPVQKVASQDVQPYSLSKILTGGSLPSKAARFGALIGCISSADALLARFNINLIEHLGLSYWLFISLLFNLFLIFEIAFFGSPSQIALSPPDDDENEIKVFHFILPTDGIKPFYNLFIESTSQCLETASDKAWLLCPRIPASSFDKLDIWQSYEEATIIRKATGGIFLLADDPDENFSKIVSRMEETNIPLVMIDVYFDRNKYDARNSARMPPFVGGDETAGGRLAAEILLSHYSQSKSKIEGTPKVLVIRGGKTTWEMQRIESFKSTMSQGASVEFVETDFFFYHRDDAFDSVYQMFSSMNKDTARRYMGIFSANDDMAMGARNALRELARSRKLTTSLPIVGYDGTPEVKRLIDHGDEFIIGTVDVRLEEQARLAVYVMKNLVEKSPVNQRVQLILPKAYRKHS